MNLKMARWLNRWLVYTIRSHNNNSSVTSHVQNICLLQRTVMLLSCNRLESITLCHSCVMKSEDVIVLDDLNKKAWCSFLSVKSFQIVQVHQAKILFHPSQCKILSNNRKVLMFLLEHLLKTDSKQSVHWTRQNKVSVISASLPRFSFWQTTRDTVLNVVFHTPY